MKKFWNHIFQGTLKERVNQAAAHGRGLTGAETADLAGRFEEMDWEYLEEEIPKALSQSRDGLQRVSDIVRAMKEFSHPGSKERGRVDMNHLIETTVTVARNEWKYVADLELDLADNLPTILGLEGEINQVLLNILVNAAQAIGQQGDETSSKNEKGLIRISSRLADDMVEVRIADTGCGMPADVKKRIFEPFFTTKAVGKGTGQGLAIAYDVIVHKHGGRLEVESVEGEGTTFVISIPLPDNGGEK